MKKIFDSDEDIAKWLAKLSEEDLRLLAGKLRRGVHYASPVFDGAQEIQIKNTLALAGLPTSGQTVLFDGRTGDAFDQEVTVGVMYMPVSYTHLREGREGARGP